MEEKYFRKVCPAGILKTAVCLVLLFIPNMAAPSEPSVDLMTEETSMSRIYHPGSPQWTSDKGPTIFNAIDLLEEKGEISWDLARLYRLYAYRDRNLLPPDLAALPYPEHPPCPAYLFYQARKEMDLYSDAVKPLMSAVLARPDSIGHVQSAVYPLRLHYETVEQIPVAEEFLGYAEMSWQYFVEAGFYTPPPDFGNGGSDDFDIYLKADAVGGAIIIEDEYPDTWWMNIYPTRRSASYPQRIYDWAAKNATTAELVEGGNGFKNARESIPFPIPKKGIEVIWNHLTRFRNDTVYRVYASIAPSPGGGVHSR